MVAEPVDGNYDDCDVVEDNDDDDDGVGDGSGCHVVAEPYKSNSDHKQVVYPSLYLVLCTGQGSPLQSFWSSPSAQAHHC